MSSITTLALEPRGLSSAGEADAELRRLRRTGLHPDFWYPLARARDLRPGKALGVSFAGEPIVLVRPQNGAVFALEDRCAHRQVPLHLGVVRGDRVQCGYHCWTYDRSGACVNVPYLDAVAGFPTACAAIRCARPMGSSSSTPATSAGWIR
jgi:Phenylpropionate dioxygenase and related ring-hydroxylating dioxygenases, large terminal subunit